MKNLIKGATDWHDTVNQNFGEVGLLLSEKANQISQLSNPNLLINSDFRIWQRGTGPFSSTGGCVYTADRWFIAGDTNPTVSKTATGALITATKVGTWTNFAQILTDDLIEYLVGKTVTITFKTKGVTNGVNQLWCGGQYNGSTFYHKNYYVTNITSDTFSMTIDITKATTRTEFGIQIKSDVAGRTVELLWAKLEIGNIATSFVPKLYVDELAACKRYYFRNAWKTLRCAGVTGTDLRTCEFNFPVEMRIPPNINVLIPQPVYQITTYNFGTNYLNPTIAQIYPVALGTANQRMCCFQFKHTLPQNDYVLDIKDYAYEFDAEIY